MFLRFIRCDMFRSLWHRPAHPQRKGGFNEPPFLMTMTDRIVSRVLLPPAGLPASSGDHSSRTAVACRLKRPTREHRAGRPYGSPIRSCSGWGLPCPPCHQGSGELLPRLFTLTCRSRRYVFCGTFLRGRPQSPLATILPCGARTFLPPGKTGPAITTSTQTSFVFS